MTEFEMRSWMVFMTGAWNLSQLLVLQWNWGRPLATTERLNSNQNKTIPRIAHQLRRLFHGQAGTGMGMCVFMLARCQLICIFLSNEFSDMYLFNTQVLI